MTTDLELRLRALRDDLPEPPAHLDLAAVVTTPPPAAVELAPASRTPRHRARWVVVGLVAAALVVGVLVAVGVVRAGSHTDRRHAVSPTLPARVDPATQVVRDGDRVQATGQVVAVDGAPVRFCAPAPVALPGSSGPVDPYAACGRYVTVTGLDLGALGERSPFAASGPYPAGIGGRVHVVGTLHGRSIEVLSATPAPYGSEVDFSGLPDVPCAPPPGGWPSGPADQNVDVSAVTDYQTAHPGTIVDLASLRPSSTQVVTYVVTVGDPAPVSAALRPVYGDALCVVQSRYSPAEIAAGAKAVDPTGPLWRLGGTYSSSPQDLGRDGQPQVTIDLEMVTDEVVSAIPPLAPGLLQLHPWLSPAH